MKETTLLQRVFTCTACSLLTASLCAQTVNVTAEIQSPVHSTKKQGVGAATPVVVWLTSIDAPRDAGLPGSYRLVQKDKMFRPHLLVLPVGSMVTFPNLDPFFHNVFSLFNGKRFDLGLYQTGSSKEVRFNHEGVSYIFCNIHPEMSAVIIALDTRYYAISDVTGAVLLHDVPEGTYQLNVWAEGVEPQGLAALSRTVHVAPAHADLGAISIQINSETTQHKNKFGEDYDHPDSTLY